MTVTVVLAPMKLPPTTSCTRSDPAPNNERRIYDVRVPTADCTSCRRHGALRTENFESTLALTRERVFHTTPGAGEGGGLNVRANPRAWASIVDPPILPLVSRSMTHRTALELRLPLSPNPALSPIPLPLPPPSSESVLIFNTIHAYCVQHIIGRRRLSPHRRCLLLAAEGRQEPPRKDSTRRKALDLGYDIQANWGGRRQQRRRVCKITGQPALTLFLPVRVPSRVESMRFDYESAGGISTVCAWAVLRPSIVITADASSFVVNPDSTSGRSSSWLTHSPAASAHRLLRPHARRPPPRTAGPSSPLLARPPGSILFDPTPRVAPPAALRTPTPAPVSVPTPAPSLLSHSHWQLPVFRFVLFPILAHRLSSPHLRPFHPPCCARARPSLPLSSSCARLHYLCKLGVYATAPRMSPPPPPPRALCPDADILRTRTRAQLGMGWEVQRFGAVFDIPRPRHAVGMLHVRLLAPHPTPVSPPTLPLGLSPPSAFLFSAPFVGRMSEKSWILWRTQKGGGAVAAKRREGTGRRRNWNGRIRTYSPIPTAPYSAIRTLHNPYGYPTATTKLGECVPGVEAVKGRGSGRRRSGTSITKGDPHGGATPGPPCPPLPPRPTVLPFSSSHRDAAGGSWT
ncbi:hypothetical protein B0H11DRAFT_2243636 [Mycena galericulata]|nr:hypothetical protein B0H11DRAFT_2243636 [Mycena galericulata]